MELGSAGSDFGVALSTQEKSESSNAELVTPKSLANDEVLHPLNNSLSSLLPESAQPEPEGHFPLLQLSLAIPPPHFFPYPTRAFA